MGLLRPALAVLAAASIAAAPLPRVRHTGTFAAGALFERFTIRQTGEETFDLELVSGKSRCVYELNWIQIKPVALVKTVDLQGALKGACAVDPSPRVDGTIVLDRDTDAGAIRLIRDGKATPITVLLAKEAL